MRAQQAELNDLIAQIQRGGFSFVPAAPMRALLEAQGALADWPAFADTWNDLAGDTYLAQVGRQRRRRYAVFDAINGQAIQRSEHQPHYQALDYNALQGNIERWFEPITPMAGNSDSLGTILEFCRNLFGALAPAVRRWHMEVHQFRIEARLDAPGEPTPEGMHRDGVDYVLVLLVQRQNIASGTTTIHAPDGQLLGSFTLSQAFDVALVDDARVFHGVTPVTPLDPTLPAHRDVLVVTLRART